MSTEQVGQEQVAPGDTRPGKVGDQFARGGRLWPFGQAGGISQRADDLLGGEPLAQPTEVKVFVPLAQPAPVMVAEQRDVEERGRRKAE